MPITKYGRVEYFRRKLRHYHRNKNKHECKWLRYVLTTDYDNVVSLGIVRSSCFLLFKLKVYFLHSSRYCRKPGTLNYLNTKIPYRYSVCSIDNLKFPLIEQQTFFHLKISYSHVIHDTEKQSKSCALSYESVLFFLSFSPLRPLSGFHPEKVVKDYKFFASKILLQLSAP